MCTYISIYVCIYVYMYIYIHICVYHNHRVGLFGHRPVLLRRSCSEKFSGCIQPRRQPAWEPAPTGWTDGWMDVSIHLINQSIFCIYIYIYYLYIYIYSDILVYVHIALYIYIYRWVAPFVEPNMSSPTCQAQHATGSLMLEICIILAATHQPNATFT